LKIGAASFSLVPDPDHMPSQGDLRGLVNAALAGNNPMVWEAWDQSRGLYKAHGDEIACLMEKVKSKGLHTFEDIKAKVLASLTREKEKLTVFNRTLKELYGKKEILLQLCRHTVLDGICEGIEFVQVHFESLWNGDLPEGYDTKVEGDYYVTFNDPKTIYGSNKGIALKSALLHLLLALYQKDTLTDLGPVLGEDWLDTSAFVHLTPIPPSVDLSDMDTSAYLFRDATGAFLANIHNGYVLGGQRGEERYKYAPKAQGPEDCSSWIGKYIFKDDILRTRHLFYACCLQIGQDKRVGELSRRHDIVQKSVAKFEPIFSIDHITPGQIYAYRKMAMDKESVGECGHTGVILGCNPDGVLMLERARWTHQEGFALRWYRYKEPEEDRFVMIFNLRD
jgi:hypothetical protein